MKKCITFIIVSLAFILSSCGKGTLLSDDGIYTPPVVKYQPRLMYPKIAQEESSTGIAKALIVISKEGKVEKVDLTESTGSKILDKAAIDYCMDLLFEPAVRDGEPVYSRMQWVIKFNVADQLWDPYFYVYGVQNLYQKIRYADETNKTELLKELLKKHAEFIDNNNDALNFNYVIQEVISASVLREWKNNWNNWPLSFLLYHDFILRFPEAKSYKQIDSLIQNAVLNDMKFIKGSVVRNIEEGLDRENVLVKIREFFKENYPDIILDDFQSETDPELLSRQD
ncbi:MAG: energy transducer TonB [Melioribacteraceae bacterium]|nr:energy transducer TonB [Melioribacteraceae bacterium]